MASRSGWVSACCFSFHDHDGDKIGACGYAQAQPAALASTAALELEDLELLLLLLEDEEDEEELLLLAPSKFAIFSLPATVLLSVCDFHSFSFQFPAGDFSF